MYHIFGDTFGQAAVFWAQVTVIILQLNQFSADYENDYNLWFLVHRIESLWLENPAVIM